MRTYGEEGERRGHLGHQKIKTKQPTNSKANTKTTGSSELSFGSGKRYEVFFKSVDEPFLAFMSRICAATTHKLFKNNVFG